MIGHQSIDQQSFHSSKTWDQIKHPCLRKRFYHVKIKSPEVASLQELGQLMDQLQHQTFRKTYGNIWDLAMIEVFVEAIASLT